MPLPTDERPRDDARYIVGRNQHLASRAARLIELIERDDALMGGYLKYRIGRRVHDELPGSDMLGAESVDHLGAARGDVADDTASHAPLERRYHLRRKPIGIGGEGSAKADAADLPVPGRAVLPRRRRAHAPPRAARRPAPIHPLQWCNTAEPERFQLRKVEPPDGAREIAERVAAGISVIGGVGRRPNANAVEHDHDRAMRHVRAPSRRYTRGMRPRSPVRSS